MFCYIGKERDHTGLDKIGMPYYKSSTGRWTQPDPARHLNPANPHEGMAWAYAANNPVNYTDPSGEGVCTYAVTSGLFALGTALLAALAIVYSGEDDHRGVYLSQEILLLLSGASASFSAVRDYRCACVLKSLVGGVQ